MSELTKNRFIVGHALSNDLEVRVVCFVCGVVRVCVTCVSRVRQVRVVMGHVCAWVSSACLERT